MKLTKTMREAFVRAVMADVPGADANALIAEAQKLILAHFVGRTPAPVQKLWEDPKTRAWVNRASYAFSPRGIDAYIPSVYVPSPEYGPEINDNELLVKLKEICKQIETANNVRKDLRSKLSAVADGCATRKQLAEALPEFEKYLPADQAQATRSVPAIANVVADFVKAGWPKGGVQPASA